MSSDRISFCTSNAYCCVPQCKGYAKNNLNLRFHRFPRVNERTKSMKDLILKVRSEWIRVLKITKEVSNSMVVCSSHFKSSDYFPTDNVKKKYLKKTAIPSLNLPLSPAELHAKKLQQEERDAQAPNVVYIKRLPVKRGRWCAVNGCKNRKGNTADTSFFSFPKDPDLRKEWIARCCRAKSFNIQNNDCTICSVHFKPDDFLKIAKPGPLCSKPRKVLKQGSVPSRNLPLDFSLSTSLSNEKHLGENKEQESDSSISSFSPSNENHSSTSTSTKHQKKTTKCCVPHCVSSSTEEHVAMFYFPATEPLRSLWLKGIQRETFEPSKCSVVCEKHFRPSDLIRNNGAFDGKRNVSSTVSMPKLRIGAVPSIMVKAQHSGSRYETLAAKRRKVQNTNDNQEISTASNVVESPLILKFQQTEIAGDESGSRDSDETDLAEETVEIEMMDRIDFIDLTELEQKLHLVDLGKFWTLVKGMRSLAFVHIRLTNDAPKIHVSVVIDENLLVSIFHGEKRINETVNFSFPIKVRNIVKLKMILDEAKAKIFTELDSSSKVELVQKLLDTLKQNTEHKVTLSFLREQVSLLIDQQKQYSPEMLIFATLLFSIAPHAYKFLIQYENIILPELEIIKNLYLPLQSFPNKDNPPIKFLKNVKESFCNRKDSDKQIVLQVEEIYLKSFLEVDENIMGMSVEMDAPATSVYVFMITSVCSDYKETVYILPVKSFKAKEIHNVFKEVIIGLERIGLRIVAVVTDDSLVNRQVMSLFSEPPLFNSIIYKHPLDSSRPLFHLISYAYLLKSIRNDWMTQNNPDKCICYPAITDDADKSMKKASFNTLKKLHEVESSSYLKCYTSLSQQAISPSNTEKDNIEFVLEIFDDIVSNRLLLYGEDHKLPHYQDTADFIKLICTWFSIVNPNSPLKEDIINGRSYAGILFTVNDKYDFLQKFLDWLDCWSNCRYDTGMLTSKTYSALHQSTYALIELTAYCVNELGTVYIAPGNFRTDHRITRYGSRKEHSIKELINKKWSSSEPELVTSENLSLTLIDLNDVNLMKLHCEQTVNWAEPIDSVNTFIPMIVTAEDMTANEGNIPVLLYLGGHCVRSVLKELNCEECKSHLSTDADMVLHPAVCENNKLPKYPSRNATNIVFLSFIVLSKLCKEHASMFWTHSNRNSLAYNLTMNILESIELCLDYQLCESGHSSSKAVKMIVRSVVYSVLNNHKNCTSEL